MTDKSEILKLLEKARYWEEDFISKYDTESTWTLLKSLPKEKFEKIKKLFSENISDTHRHSRVVNELIEKIKSDKYEL